MIDDIPLVLFKAKDIVVDGFELFRINTFLIKNCQLVQS